MFKAIRGIALKYLSGRIVIFALRGDFYLCMITASGVMIVHYSSSFSLSTLTCILCILISTYYTYYLENKSRQISFNHDYNKIFSISPRKWWYSPFDIRIWCSNQEPFRMLLPLLRHVVSLNDGNCGLTMPVKWSGAREALHHTFDIGVFKSVKKNSTTIKTHLQWICKHNWMM